MSEEHLFRVIELAVLAVSVMLSYRRAERLHHMEHPRSGLYATAQDVLTGLLVAGVVLAAVVMIQGR